MSSKTNTAADMRAKDVAALKTEIKELQKAQFTLRMQKGTQQLNNTAQLPGTRRAIARAKTILTQKQDKQSAVAQ